MTQQRGLRQMFAILRRAMNSDKPTSEDLAKLCGMRAAGSWKIGTQQDRLVSNLTVIRSLQKFLLFGVIGLCAVLIFVLVASQVGQHIFRKRSEILLAQLQSLELGKTSWQDAQRQLKGWIGETKLDDRCNQAECSAFITLTEPSWVWIPRPVFVRLDDYLRWRLKLSYSQGPFAWMAQQALLPGYMLMGGRPARIIATVGMRDGVVSSLGFFVGVETYRHFNPGRWAEYTLAADVRSVPRFDDFDRIRDAAQLVIHPNYLISRPSGCEGCIEVYLYFNRNTEIADVRRLTQPNLSCLTRIHPCLDEIDIMPAAWKQYLAENSRQ